MGRLIIVILFLAVSVGAWAQTCTISGTVQWSNLGPTCADGGTIIIPLGASLEFDSNGDTWTGTNIIVEGSLIISFDVTINASLEVKSGGVVTVGKKLSLGTSASNPSGCNYTVIIRSGGTINVTDTGTDRLSICGTSIMKGSGACNDCGGTNSGTCAYNNQPYCEPSGGFQGPLGYDQTGSNQALPIELLYFNVSIPKNENQTLIEWATEEEENFDHFEVQRAGNDLQFATILEEPGAGYNTNSLQKYTAFDENPLVGRGYYRLKAVDIDGTVEYFKVKSVNYNGNRKLLVSPNPVSGSSIKYTLNFDPGPYDRVTLINQVGTELVSTTVTAIENELALDSKLRPGAYLLRYSSPTFQYVARVFIKD